MSIRADIDKLKELLKPKAKLEIKIIHSMDEVTDVDAAIWVLFTI